MSAAAVVNLAVGAWVVLLVGAALEVLLGRRLRDLGRHHARLMRDHRLLRLFLLAIGLFFIARMAMAINGAPL